MKNNAAAYMKAFESFEGIRDLFKDSMISDWTGYAANVFQMSEEEIAGAEIECFGSSGNKEKYINIQNELWDNSSYFVDMYEHITDEVSRRILFGLIRFWLLPDASFLDFSEQPTHYLEHDWSEVKSFYTPNEIKQNADSIRLMQPDSVAMVKIENALSDLWRVFELLYAIRDDLYFKLIFVSPEEIELHAHTLILYERPNTEKPLRVCSIAKMDGEWQNHQLLKDNGLVPYLLHKEFGYDSVMVGRDNGDYPYLKEYLDGLKMDFLPNGTVEEKTEYISNHAKEIDILIVNSVYYLNEAIVAEYKRQHPDGLTYMMLDASADWMDRIDMRSSSFIKMMDSIDVIGTSGKIMQRHLNEKWPWPIEHFPNGYYHPWTSIDEVDFDRKENVILTVARLGTYQKATEVMLTAFAEVADDIPDWSLRLVGSIEPSFEKEINAFYENNPSLKGRVEFTGPISDKNVLFEEYKKAKIFILTSRMEGGTPNVIAEALHCGCAVATTRIDACEDATNAGKCGMVADIDNIPEIADMIREMCGDEKRLREMCIGAHQYSEMKYSMEKIVNRIHESLLEKCYG